MTLFRYISRGLLAAATLTTCATGVSSAAYYSLLYGTDVDGLEAGSIQLSIAAPFWELTSQPNPNPIHMGIQARLGSISRSDSSVAFFAVGPEIRWTFHDDVTISISSLPAVLTDSNLGDHRLGGNLQFVSSFEFEYALGKGWFISAQAQHISNAGIYRRNPGLNLIIVGLSKEI